MQFEHLFSPIQVGSMRVRNRICETTNTINSSMTPSLIDEHYIAHHGAKARGGTGWIGGETWLLDVPMPVGSFNEVSLRGGFSSRFAAYQSQAFGESWRKFVDEIHGSGSVVIAQLAHLNAVWAPSALPVVGAQDYTPHVLGEAEIDFLLDSYAKAAVVAKNSGSDGVEIHCAHETTGHNFLSPATNRRTDRWGGSPKERVRFVVEALKRVRNVIGDSMALGVRVNGQESRQGGYDNLELREMVYYIAEAGLPEIDEALRAGFETRDIVGGIEMGRPGDGAILDFKGRQVALHVHGELDLEETMAVSPIHRGGKLQVSAGGIEGNPDRHATRGEFVGEFEAAAQGAFLEDSDAFGPWNRLPGFEVEDVHIPGIPVIGMVVVEDEGIGLRARKDALPSAFHLNEMDEFAGGEELGADLAVFEREVAAFTDHRTG